MRRKFRFPESRLVTRNGIRLWTRIPTCRQHSNASLKLKRAMKAVNAAKELRERVIFGCCFKMRKRCSAVRRESRLFWVTGVLEDKALWLAFEDFQMSCLAKAF